MNQPELPLRRLQPSQLYVSEEKLTRVRAWLDPEDLSSFEPLPVKLLDDLPVLTDGHTRAVAALMAGLEQVPLVWDEDDLDWELYRRCVWACREEGIHSPVDLTDRILSAEDYDVKWNGWCDALHARLMDERSKERA